MHELYVSGATLEEIGTRFGVSRERVRQIFREAELPVRSTAETHALRHDRLLRERGEEICAAFSESKDAEEVSRRLEVPRVAVEEIIKRHFPPTERRRRRRATAPRYPTEELIACLQEAGAAARGALTTGEYGAYAKGRQTENGRPWPSDQTYVNRFGSWRAALLQAGLPVNPRAPRPPKRKFSDQDCIQALRDAARALGKAPTAAEYDAFVKASKKSLPGPGTVRKRCGTWYEALSKACL